MKYVFTGETKIVNGVILNKIKRLSDGLIGGWIEKESNLSHKGDCFVYDEAVVFGYAHVSGDAKVSGCAMVFGNAKVYGYALVSGNALVFGKDIVTKKAIFIGGLPQHDITLADNHINIGCEQHTAEVWLEKYKEISNKRGYSEKEIEIYGAQIKVLALLKQL